MGFPCEISGEWLYCVTPKYLASLTSSRICVCPFKEYLFSIGVLDLVMDMELHFPGWNSIPHVSSHSSRCCNMSWSCCVCMVLYRIQSSANDLVFEATDSGRSFRKMRKSSGPSTDPCGTPLTTGSWLEISPSNNTCWFLLLSSQLYKVRDKVMIDTQYQCLYVFPLSVIHWYRWINIRKIWKTYFYIKVLISTLQIPLKKINFYTTAVSHRDGR